MRMVDIIIKKRDGLRLSKEEIEFVINGYTKGQIPDYQMSALAMAIVFKGMEKDEIVNLTSTMLHSGDIIDLSKIDGVKVDKHSTGGVGDKTSLVLGPLVASCGVKLAKMSGRGLGHTGGTLDKLESIPNFQIALDEKDFIKQVNDIGIAIVGQTANLVPADKKMYALRDVTGTVESIPLIASSIMSKKLASGSDTILLDVKFGSGAFMKNVESAKTLAKTMVEIGNSLNKDTRAIITDMTQPLGLAIGNALEVKEAIDTLHGKGPKDFVELCLSAGSIMLEQAKVCKDEKQARKLLLEKLNNGEAFNKFVEFVKAQHGDISYVLDPSKFELAKNIIQIKAQKSGYVDEINCLEIGESAMRLGAGRKTINDKIDMAAGIILNKKVGDYVSVNETLCYAHTNIDDYEKILQDIHDSFKILDNKVNVNPIVHDYIK